MLSGFMLNLFDNIITIIIIAPSKRLANDAVHIEPVTSTNELTRSSLFSVISLSNDAPTLAKKPTTIACTLNLL